MSEFHDEQRMANRERDEEYEREEYDDERQRELAHEREEYDDERQRARAHERALQLDDDYAGAYETMDQDQTQPDGSCVPPWLPDATRRADRRAADMEDERAAALVAAVYQDDIPGLEELLSPPHYHWVTPEASASSVSQALVHAVRQGALASFRMLVDAGGDITTTDAYGQTLLHTAVANGRVQMCAVLLGPPALPGVMRMVETRSGVERHTPLLLAAAASGDSLSSRRAYDVIECAKLLLRSGANARAENSHGHSAIAITRARGSYALANWLDRTKDFDRIHWACESRDPPTLLDMLRGDEAPFLDGACNTYSSSLAVLYLKSTKITSPAGTVLPDVVDGSKFWGSAAMRGWGCHHACHLPGSVWDTGAPPPTPLAICASGSPNLALSGEGHLAQTGGCPEMQRLLHAALMPWSPATHSVQMASFRRGAMAVMCAAQRLSSLASARQQGGGGPPGLPDLPSTAWLNVLAFCTRTHWWDI